MPEPGGPEAEDQLATLRPPDGAGRQPPRRRLGRRRRPPPADAAAGHLRAPRARARPQPPGRRRRRAQRRRCPDRRARHGRRGVCRPGGPAHRRAARRGRRGRRARSCRPCSRSGCPRTAASTPTGTTVTAWVRAASLTNGRRVLVPAAAVMPHGEHNGARAFTRGPAGTGVDPTAAGARGAALLSALAHDALVETIRGRRTATRLVLGEREDDAVLTFLVRTAGHLGVESEVLDLGDDLPAPTVLVRGVDPRDGSALWSLAADTTRRAATVTALRDLLGRVQLAAALPGETVDAGDPVVADLDPRTLAGGRRAAVAGPGGHAAARPRRLRDRGSSPWWSTGSRPTWRLRACPWRGSCWPVTRPPGGPGERRPPARPARDRGGVGAHPARPRGDGRARARVVGPSRPGGRARARRRGRARRGARDRDGRRHHRR